MGTSEAHVWNLPDPENFDLDDEILSAEERARARSFRFPRDRSRFITCHTFLRRLLGGYGSKDPRDVTLLYGRYGKPSESSGTQHFNMSHCDGMAVFAFSRTDEVGIDVERIRSLPDMHELIGKYGAPEDLRKFAALPAEQLNEVFFRWWTVREAQVKCTGEGLRALEQPIELGEVMVSPLRDTTLSVDGQRYRIFKINPGKDFVGALCSSPETREVRMMDATALLSKETSCCH